MQNELDQLRSQLKNKEKLINTLHTQAARLLAFILMTIHYLKSEKDILILKVAIPVNGAESTIILVIRNNWGISPG